MRTHDGLHLHVSVDGRDDAPVTVVLVHGWTEDHDLWRYQVRDLRRQLGDRVRVVAYDHRGHGGSDPTTYAGATITNLARDLADVIDTYAPTGALVLAGHSLGGMTIMELCTLRPELFAGRVAGVTLVSTSGGRLDTVTLGMPRLGPRLRQQLPSLLARRARVLGRRRRRQAPALEMWVARRFLFGPGARLRDQMLIVESLIACPPSTMSGFFADMMLHERHTTLGVLASIPTVVLVGERDLLTPVPHARRLAASIPGSRLVVAPRAGHMLPLERDALVSDAILRLVCQALEERGQATRSEASA